MKKLKVYEICTKLYLKKELLNEQTLYYISKLISGYLAQNEKMLALHNSKEYKPYCFDSLYPISNDGIYREDSIFQFRIRTVDVNLAEYFYNSFDDYSDNVFKNLKVSIREIKKVPIDKLWTITPIVIKNNIGYWKKEISQEEYENRILGNLEKKYRYFVSETDKNSSFYSSIKFLNDKPIKNKYKSINLLGDKIELKLKMDERSQELAYFALGVGLGEMSAALGTGFLGYRYL